MYFLGALALVVGGVALASMSRDSGRDDATKVSLKPGQTTTTGAIAGAGLDTGELKKLDNKESVGGVFGADEIPLSLSTSDTKDLQAGDPVAVRVTPHEGSVVYGFEAFLCRSGETYKFDADVRPTLTGKCARQPLSEGSDRYLEVKAAPPYEVAEGVFRVGVGTDSYQTKDGRTVTVTCDRDNPCVVVTKVQFPNGFGFEVIPVTYR